MEWVSRMVQVNSEIVRSLGGFHYCSCCRWQWIILSSKCTGRSFSRDAKSNLFPPRRVNNGVDCGVKRVYRCRILGDDPFLGRTGECTHRPTSFGCNLLDCRLYELAANRPIHETVWTSINRMNSALHPYTIVTFWRYHVCNPTVGAALTDKILHRKLAEC